MSTRFCLLWITFCCAQCTLFGQYGGGAGYGSAGGGREGTTLTGESTDGMFRGGEGGGSTRAGSETEGLALPLNLIQFEAREVGAYVRLDWATTDERATSHFDLERSVDGVEFHSIGRVAAAGYSGPGQEHDYLYRDESAPTGRLYYRLRSVDLDGSYTYSDVRSVVLAAATEEVAVFPNPSPDGRVSLRLPAGYRGGVIDLYDPAGRSVYHRQLLADPGAEWVELPLADLGPGIFLLTVNRPGLPVITRQLILATQ